MSKIPSEMINAALDAWYATESNGDTVSQMEAALLAALSSPIMWRLSADVFKKALEENRYDISVDDYESPNLTIENVMEIYRSVLNHAFLIPDVVG